MCVCVDFHEVALMYLPKVSHGTSITGTSFHAFFCNYILRLLQTACIAADLCMQSLAHN